MLMELIFVQWGRPVLVATTNLACALRVRFLLLQRLHQCWGRCWAKGCSRSVNLHFVFDSFLLLRYLKFLVEKHFKHGKMFFDNMEHASKQTNKQQVLLGRCLRSHESWLKSFLGNILGTTETCNHYLTFSNHPGSSSDVNKPNSFL